MLRQKEILAAQHGALVGETLEVLVDGHHPERSGVTVARTARDAPEVDCRVELTDPGLRSGDLLLAQITGVDDYDLQARVAGTASAR